MANQVNIVSFHSRIELFGHTEQLLRASIQNGNQIGIGSNVLLSGGSTPIPLYENIGKDEKFVTSVNWALVDERFVPQADKASNEGMIRSLLGPKASITGMVYAYPDYEANLYQAERAYQFLNNEIAFTLLGMGTDGHVASLFPDEQKSDDAMRSRRIGLVNTSAPADPIRRISCSLQMLVQSKVICILLTGREKYDLVHQDELNLPIHELLKLRPDCFIYYAD